MDRSPGCTSSPKARRRACEDASSTRRRLFSTPAKEQESSDAEGKGDEEELSGSDQEDKDLFKEKYKMAPSTPKVRKSRRRPRSSGKKAQSAKKPRMQHPSTEDAQQDEKASKDPEMEPDRKAFSGEVDDSEVVQAELVDLFSPKASELLCCRKSAVTVSLP